MARVGRTVGALGVAVVVTTGLLWLMQFLVHGSAAFPDHVSATPVIEFRQVIPEPRHEQPPRQKPPEKPPEKVPPKPTLQVEQVARPSLANIDVKYNVDLPLDGAGPYLPTGWGGIGGAGGQLVPLVRISPPYPYRAALAGIEGWVKLEFTVTETGSVSDPHVIAAQPPHIFDQAAIKAILKWKFQPRKVDGSPVRVRAAQTIDFTLAGM